MNRHLLSYLLCICIVLDIYCCFIACFKRCDGIILPEHTDSRYMGKAKGYFGTSADTCNGVKLSCFNYDAKELSHSNHVELRKNALLMHLEGMHDILSGVAVMEDTVDCIESVCATFLSLHKNYLYYKESNYPFHFKDHQWSFNYTEMVCLSCIYVHICVVYTLHTS